MTDVAHSRVLESLQDALRWEHTCIAQFLIHAYRIEDLQTLHAIEGIARQDMRHFKWLAELIVKLGGKPTLERHPLFVEPAHPLIWLQADLSLVEEASARYRLHLDAAQDDASIRLFTRLVDDEEAHRQRLMSLVEYWRQQPQAIEPLETDHMGEHQLDASTRGFLDFAINHEYEVILQYLQHSFMLEDQKASRELEEIAIEEMRHLGWLSEKLVDRGGCPFWNAQRLELHDDAVRMLELDQARELEVEADYHQMMAAMSDPEIRQLFDRIGVHEKFHATALGELITRLKAARGADSPPGPGRQTVGSLLGQPQG